MVENPFTTGLENTVDVTPNTSETPDPISTSTVDVTQSSTFPISSGSENILVTDLEITTSETPKNTTTIAATTTNISKSSQKPCADDIYGLTCTDLTDVCVSVLAASICPKFCGL